MGQASGNQEAVRTGTLCVRKDEEMSPVSMTRTLTGGSLQVSEQRRLYAGEGEVKSQHSWEEPRMDGRKTVLGSSKGCGVIHSHG